MRRVLGILALSGVLLASVACRREPPPAPGPRPVLVVQASAAADKALTTYPGEIRASQESALAFRIPGNLVKRNVDVGSVVKSGQVLAVLDPGDVDLQAQASQAQLGAAQAELARTQADQARYAKLADQQLVSRSSLDAQVAALRAAQGQERAARANLDVARNQSAYSQLRAPRDGVIATRLVEAGQVVAAGQTVFTLAGATGREVAIDLPEARIRDFRIGQPVLVELWSQPGRRLPGTIRTISPAADGASRTFAARVAIDAAGASDVELGQSARVYVPTATTGEGLSLPLSAVQRGADGASAVWVVDTKTRKLVATPVKLGPMGEERVPVLSGLPRDAWVVAAGGHLLRAGELVAPVDRDNRPVLQPAGP